MPEPDELSLFAIRLEAIAAPYMITGATAAILYGQPTGDTRVLLRVAAKHFKAVLEGVL